MRFKVILFSVAFACAALVYLVFSTLQSAPQIIDAELKNYVSTHIPNGKYASESMTVNLMTGSINLRNVSLSGDSRSASFQANAKSLVACVNLNDLLQRKVTVTGVTLTSPSLSVVLKKIPYGKPVSKVRKIKEASVAFPWQIDKITLTNGRFEMIDRHFENAKLNASAINVTMTDVGSDKNTIPMTLSMNTLDGFVKASGTIGDKSDVSFEVSEIETLELNPWLYSQGWTIKNAIISAQGTVTTHEKPTLRLSSEIRNIEYNTVNVFSNVITNLDIKGLHYVDDTPPILTIDEVHTQLLGSTIANVVTGLASIVTDTLRTAGANTIGSGLDSVAATASGDITLKNLKLEDGQLRPESDSVTNIGKAVTTLIEEIFATFLFFL